MDKERVSNIIRSIIFVLMLIFLGKMIFGYIFHYGAYKEKQHEKEVSNIIEQRLSILSREETEDPFGEDDIVKILLVGLDSRAGEVSAHCDAIQLIEINREDQLIKITAVPRGTYSPLPPGKGTTSSDYYVSNSCALGGIDYGVGQIERILGVKADYLVFAGFSEVIGMFRALKLPTTETLQWLRNRQGYAIGEPQRARNHSNFLKKMLIEFIPENQTKINTALQYLLYTFIQTDLSFVQVQQITDELIKMNLRENVDKIKLDMRPAHEVQDIEYNTENIDAYLNSTVGTIKHWLSKEDYLGLTKEEIQKQLIDLIDSKKDDLDFISWSYDNHIWLQIEDAKEREQVHFDIISKYVLSLSDIEIQKEIVNDYIFEMKYWGEKYWEDMGRVLLDRLGAQEDA